MTTNETELRRVLFSVGHPDAGPAMLLELAATLIDLAETLRTLAILWHKEQEG